MKFAFATTFCMLGAVGLIACDDEKPGVTHASRDAGRDGAAVDDAQIGDAGADVPFIDFDGATPFDFDGGVEPDAGPVVAYAFESRFVEGESSVEYGLRAAQQVLLEGLDERLAGLQDDLDAERVSITATIDAIVYLDGRYHFEPGVSGSLALPIRTEPAALQTTWSALGDDFDLARSTAGNAPATEHRDWSTDFGYWTDGTFADYGGATSSPEGLLLAAFGQAGHAALVHLDDGVRVCPADPSESPLPLHVTEDGRDLRALVRGLLLGATFFASAVDGDLDDDLDGTGLRSSHERDGEAPYSALEHAWDRAFGAWGGARDLDAYADEEIAGAGGREAYQHGYYDTNGDGAIDLTREHCFGAAVLAAARDATSAAGTDFTGEAFSAFLQGRALLASTAGAPLSVEDQATLADARDRIVRAWEATLAATLIHELNATLAQMAAAGTSEYGCLAHAEHWSMAKGLAFAFQFNPRSSLSHDDFVSLHALLGDAPVLADASSELRGVHAANLRAARAILAAAFAFDPVDLGDDVGAGGW